MGLPDRPSKHEAFLALMQEGRTSLHLDARRAGVLVPEHLKNEAHLVLEYGMDLKIPIPDLQVDEQGVSATLSFARSPHQTVVPWSAVYVVASEDGRGVLYHEDIPKDVSVIAGGGDENAADGNAKNGPRRSTPGLAVELASRPSPTRALRAVPLRGTIDRIDDDGIGTVADEASDDTPVEAMPARRKKRPQLRLVK